MSSSAMNFESYFLRCCLKPQSSIVDCGQFCCDSMSLCSHGFYQRQEFDEWVKIHYPYMHLLQQYFNAFISLFHSEILLQNFKRLKCSLLETAILSLILKPIYANLEHIEQTAQEEKSFFALQHCYQWNNLQRLLTMSLCYWYLSIGQNLLRLHWTH